MANIVEKDVEALLLKERVFRRRPGDVPYPLKSSNDMLNYDNWDHRFMINCFKGLTMNQFDSPPERTLDLGCGGGLWVIDTARQWQNSTFIGFDVKNIQPKLQDLDPYKDIAQRVQWVHGNLLDGLPFPSEHFDFVRMARIGLGVPEDEWQFVLEEVSRVMKPGAVLEIFEEDLVFPYCQASRRRPRPAPLDVDLLRSDSLPSTRSSMTAFSATPWEDYEPLELNKSSLSTLQESPTSTFTPSISNFSPGPKSAHTYKAHVTPPSIPPPIPPSSKFSQASPQDHSRLKAAWDAMLSRRFLAPQLITVLPFYLSSWFEDIKTHPILHIPLPRNSSPDSRIFCPIGDESLPSAFSDDQFTLSRSTGSRQSDSDEKSISSTSSKGSSKTAPSWAPMHLARTVQTVRACKEAIWEEYSKLYSPDLPPTISQAQLKEGHRAVTANARESFDQAWDNWENDMTDRIGMRDNIMFQLLWAEPPGERPDWRLWRNSLVIQEENPPPRDVCRTLRGFVAWKPK